MDPIISSYGKELKELKTLLALRTFQNILIKASNNVDISSTPLFNKLMHLQNLEHYIPMKTMTI